MNRANPVGTTLTALCVLLSAWPISTLLRGGMWMRELFFVVLAVALLGYAGRALRVSPVLIVIGQMLGVLALSWLMFVAPHVSPGDLDSTLRVLFTDANNTIHRYAAPAPETRGLRFVLVTSLGLLAVVADAMAVGGRMPALAGIPLMVTFLVAASNTTSSLPMRYFLAPTIIWLILLWWDNTLGIRSWSSARAVSDAPTLLTDRLGIGSLASAARGIGVVALLGALLVPMAIPHLHPRFLADGLGKTSSSGARVGFSSTLDLTRNLESNDPTPVITYLTTDPSPAPLRVLVSSTYNSNGTWAPDPVRSDVRASGERTLPMPTGLSGNANYVPQTVTVKSSSMAAGLLASPAPTLRVNLPDNSWRADRATSVVAPDGAASAYTVTYAGLNSTAAPGSSSEPTLGFESTLQVSPQARAQLQQTMRQIPTGGNPWDTAVNIQNYLRNDGGFVYSLQLAPRRTVGGQEADPLTNFLLTKQGYCVQFASAMVMLARTQGIPARMAMGFLPGSSNSSGLFTVLQSDAHAWPELYFPSLGWTRFEPTPSARTGAAPLYAVPHQQRAGRESSAPTQATRSTAPTATSTSQAAPTPTTNRSSAPDLMPILITLGIIALVVAAVLVVPLLAARHRRTLVADANEPAQLVEVQWQLLQDRLDDLGLQDPGRRSPRELAEHYRKTGLLGRPGVEAMQRVTATLEQARYARPSQAAISLEPQAHQVVRQVRAHASFRARLRALLWPRTGRRAITEWARERVNRGRS